MAYTSDTLKMVSTGARPPSGGAAHPGLFHYATNDTQATVAGSNYFNSAAGVLVKGSIIFVSGDLDGTPALRTYMVTANDGTTVTIALSTATAAA